MGRAGERSQERANGSGVGLSYAVTKFLVLDGAIYVGDEPRVQAFTGLTFSIFVPPR